MYPVRGRQILTLPGTPYDAGRCGPVDYQRLIDVADEYIVEHTRRVVVVFLVLSAVFAAGLTNVSTETGTEQFAEEVPEQEALDRVEAEFESPFAQAEGTTQLIQTGENVLSKPGLLRMLRLLDRIQDREGLRVATTSSAAQVVARTLATDAETLEAQIRAVEDASPGQVAAAVETAAETDPGFTRLLSTDFNPGAASASATVAVVRHSLPAEPPDQGGGTDPLTPIQREIERVATAAGGDVRVFGSGILADEFGTVIGDTLLVVIPAAALLIVLFLVVAYRDLVDLLLGIVSLVMAIVWTLGFMGLVGLPFNQILIAVPPLLLAVGIDFGIHAVNRYREEREGGLGVNEAMRVTTDQLLVAFSIVAATSVIGFASNLASQLLPIRDFGLVAAVGILFTLAIFGIFLPAAKVGVDRLRTRYPIPTFSERPLGGEGTRLGAVLGVGVGIARRAPLAFLLVVALLTAGAAGYATGVDTSFSQEQFLPPEETPPFLAALPEPFRPSEYTVTRDINFLEENFETGEEETVTVFVEAPMERDTTLESIARAGRDPPPTFVREGDGASEQSIVTVIRQFAAVDPAFRDLVRRNDRDGNGIPDRNLEMVYDALFASRFGDLAGEFLARDRRSTRVVYAVEADADQDEVTADARAVAERFPFEATATGSIVVFAAIADLILQSALVSLAVALAATAVLLVLIYWVIADRPTLGLANLTPIVVTVALVAGTMRLVGLSLNAFTATVLAITIGLGIDYSVHVVHRFLDEMEGEAVGSERVGEPGPSGPGEPDARPVGDGTGSSGGDAGLDVHDPGTEPETRTGDGERDALAALERTVTGTGGALTGSVLTTVFGIGVLVLSVFPAIGQFGLLTGLSVIYSYLASLLVLPPVLYVWARARA